MSDPENCAVEQTDDISQRQRRQWEEEQDALKGRLVLCDDFQWNVSALDGNSNLNSCSQLRFVAGVDLSFCKKDPAIACGALVVMDIHTMAVVYDDFEIVHLVLPYVPGFLAFRESPVLLGLLKKLRAHRLDLYPQVLMVDGNGILHPRGFGLACHLGVLADIPAIGIAKNLHYVDGLSRQEWRLVLGNNETRTQEAMPLIGKSGQVLGMALRSHQECKNPVFVSVGHRISLQTAVALVQSCCRYRVPEPVRQADIRSREKIRVEFGT